MSKGLAALFRVKRNVLWGQWANTLFVIQVKGNALLIGDVDPHPIKGRYYAYRLEIMTPERWFRFRIGGRMDFHRRVRNMAQRNS